MSAVNGNGWFAAPVERPRPRGGFHALAAALLRRCRAASRAQRSSIRSPSLRSANSVSAARAGGWSRLRFARDGRGAGAGSPGGSAPLEADAGAAKGRVTVGVRFRDIRRRLTGWAATPLPSNCWRALASLNSSLAGCHHDKAMELSPFEFILMAVAAIVMAADEAIARTDALNRIVPRLRGSAPFTWTKAGFEREIGFGGFEHLAAPS
jgi:hypothetical protein